MTKTFGETLSDYELKTEASYMRRMEEADRENERLQDAIDKADSDIHGDAALLDEAVSEYLQSKADSKQYEAWANALHSVYTESFQANLQKATTLLQDLRMEIDHAVEYYSEVLAKHRIEDEDAKAMEP